MNFNNSNHEAYINSNRKRTGSYVSIVSWNVNGLRAIFRKGFDDFIRKNSFDIICLQETKIQEDKIPDELKNVGGYNLYLSSATRPGYSGVGIYSKIRPEEYGTGFDDEGRIIWHHYKDFMIFNTYMPNGGREKKRLLYKLEFYDRFLLHIENLLKENRNIIITGDINTAHKPIDLARPKQNEKNTGFLPEERAWIDRLISAGFIDAFRMFNNEPGNYTWWDYKTKSRERNVGWRLDYFFVSKDMAKSIKNCRIMSDVMGSDHCPVVLELSL